jgi:chorismate synthase
MLSINAVKGFEYGSGFVELKWKVVNTTIYTIQTELQNKSSGGIQGGISNGMDIYFRVAFKPVATIMQKTRVVR